MKLRLRFALLLGLLLAGFAIALIAVRGVDQRFMAQSALDERQNRELLLNHWLDLTGRALPQIAADYAEQLSTVSRSRLTSEYLQEKIRPDLMRTGLDRVWLLDAGGTPVAQTMRETQTPVIPIAAADFLALVSQTPNPRFFAEAGDTFIEIAVRRLASSAASGAADATWLLVSRRWDKTLLELLTDLTGSEVSLVAPSAMASPASGGGIVLLRPLLDWQGHPLRLLRVNYQDPALDRTERSNRGQVAVVISFGLLVLVAMWLALQAWVLRPLGLISTSLKNENREVISPLRSEASELGAVAQLVTSSFEQREALEREVEERARAEEALRKSEVALRRTMEERARLGRDLHDGVIQSLYAAGMGLTGIRSQLNHDQGEAAARLEQTRATLNESIHDLRNFINGLEPESLKLQNFTQAVTALLEVVQGLRPLATAISIDESLANQLTLSQRVHALQIAREAVSNALRHGDASRVTIALRAAGEKVEFEVTDNGRGFDPTAASARGFGLENFAGRARELGAELRVNSLPGHGTRVHLIFALFKSL